MATSRFAGFGPARMDDVGQVVGVSKGGLYLHFKSKDELNGALDGWLVERRKLALLLAWRGWADPGR